MLKRVIGNMLDLPKTLYVNFKGLEFKEAIKFPIKVSHKVKVGKLYRGCFKFNSPLKRSMVKLGYHGTTFISENKSYLSVDNGVIVFSNDVTLGEGFSICVENGYIEFEEKFYANKNFQIQSEEKIIIGRNCLIGWNVSIRDTDGHNVYEASKVTSLKGSIMIGNDVWIASDCTILKRTKITNGSVVGCMSLVCGLKMKENNCLVGGIPGKVIKKNISWEK